MRIVAVPYLPVEGLVLRPLEQSDAEAWYEYVAMPNVVSETTWNLQSVDDIRPLITWYNSEEPASGIRFAISSLATGRLVGTIGFHTISLPNRTAELAYDIHPDYWRRGIGSACCSAVTAWGLSERAYVRVQALTLVTNVPSVRLLEKCGFAREGTLRSYRIVGGEPRDFHVFARLPVAVSTR